MSLSEPGPYPLADDHWPLTLPVAEVTLASMHPCWRCMGHGITARNEGPCKACDGRAAILPGGVVLFDCAARWHAQYASLRGNDLAIVSAVARLRSPWRGQGGWYTEQAPEGEELGTTRASREARATGVHSLRRAAEDAVCTALAAQGIAHRSIVWQSAFEWPATWGVSHFAMNVREALLMGLDLPPESVRQ